MIFLKIALAGIAGFSAVYYAATSILIACWMRGKKAGRASPADGPVTFFRPIKPGVPRLREKLEMLIAASAAGDQIIFGIDEKSPEAAVCEGVRAAHPRREFGIVKVSADAAGNPKIAKLVAMTPHAQHERWIVSDSEAMMDAGFVEKFRAEWAAGGADVLTAPYRFAGAESLQQRLDQAAVLLTLWPGIAVARACGRVRFTLGACTAMTKSDVARAGGWENFSAYLAEDNRLGAALAAAGRRIALSGEVLSLDSDPLTWRDYFFHQHRAAVTYRVSNPAGYFFMAITHGVTAGALACLVPKLAPANWILFGAIWAARTVSGARNAAATGFRIRPGRFFFEVLIASFAETFFWVLCRFPVRVRWGRRRFRIGVGGRIFR